MEAELTGRRRASWAGQQGYTVTTLSQFDEESEGRPKVGLYARFERFKELGVPRRDPGI